jgi:hypothetical protein
MYSSVTVKLQLGDQNLSFYSGWGSFGRKTSLERYIHKHGCNGGTVVLKWVACCVCVCLCVSPEVFRGLLKRLGTLTFSLLAFFLCLKTSWSQKFSFRCLRCAMRNLFTCPIIRTRNITSGKTNYIIWYCVPDRTDGFYVRDCEKGVKFRTLYPLTFLLFLISSLALGRDRHSLLLGLLGPYLGIPVLALSVV